MQTERKRFSYLTVQQRALNTSNAVDTEKIPTTSRTPYLQTSNTKSHQKEDSLITQQLYTSISRNSSAKKTPQPLSDLSQNPIFSGLKPLVTRNPLISNKQNLPERQSLKNNEKPSNFTTPRSSADQSLQSRIKELEEQNCLILKQTEDKFMLMEQHLEKVQGILKEKQASIQNLMKENMNFKEKIESLESANGKLSEQKEELIKIISQKNEEIKKLTTERQNMSQKQVQLVEQLNTYTLQSKLSTLQSTKIHSVISTEAFEVQTDLKLSDIDQIISKSKESQGTDKLNYRQKYEALFKRALEMEDEMYRLKEELFDSQNQVKTIQQEFNTYKIFNQIEKISASS